jgi:molybdenum ABC transporter molybdate-binding protein
VGLRLWIERSGQAILGKGRLELLDAIYRNHSISAAARQMGMSYRRAWELVQSINGSAGESLVLAATGGVQGGGAQLSPLGRWAVSVFRALQQSVTQSAVNMLPQLVQHEDTPSIHIAAAVSLEEVLGQLLAEYALLQPTVRIRAIFGGSDELADHLLSGAPADLFLTADRRQFDRLAGAGLVDRNSSTLLAANGLAAISLSEHRHRIRKPADVAGAAFVRIAVANESCPLGRYTRDYFKATGLHEKLKARLMSVDNSRAVLSAIRAGQADVGWVYSSDAAHAEGCRVLFRTKHPPVPIEYSAALIDRGEIHACSRQLLDFLISKTAQRRFRLCGFLPAKRIHSDRPTRKPKR